jgi:sporulation protein YlmC with PRC-barrel domain
VDGEIARTDGAEIAEIDSLVLDRATGGIVYVLLKTDVDLEDADQVVAVPWSALQVTEDANDALDRITFTLDTAVLVSAPPLVVNDLFNYNDPAWDDPSAAYWSSQASSLLPATGADVSAVGMLRLKDEDDLRLVDAQGGQVAEVKEVIVDPASGQFRYVVVEPASNLGAVEVRVPIPFEKLSWNTSAPDALLLNVDRVALDAAPSFPGDGALPDTASPGWDAAIQQYWAAK